MTVQWRDLLVAWLHDPPDKALDIARHQARARKYTAAALGDPVTSEEQKDPSDALAAVAERLPCPHWTQHKVDMADGRLERRHPLSGVAQILQPLPHRVDDVVLSAISALVAGLDSTERRLLALWRLLPERLAADGHAWFADLPADTRVPDHSIWRHLDVTAGLKGAEAGESHGAAFLSFSLGPVQSFIAAARSVRDLWSGSMLLAWLTWRGLRPVIETLGPTAVVYPYLRGAPWLDEWLRRERGLENLLDSEETQRYTPCIPNRFLALVPWGLEGRAAAELAERCRTGALDAWREIARDVHSQLDREWRRLDEHWDRQWDGQVESFFDVRTAVLPWKATTDDEEIGRLLVQSGGFAAAFPEAAKVRAMAAAIPADERPGYDQSTAGQWQARVELSARLLHALRNVRYLPPATQVDNTGEMLPGKCSLLGTFEQMGPGERRAADNFWKSAATTNVGGVRVRDNERLCAVALVKRFCGPAFFKRELRLERETLRYEDTATVAAADWLDEAKIDPQQVRDVHKRWSGQWLHWPKNTADAAEEKCPDAVWTQIVHARDPRNIGRAPAYYAVLMMDGDRLGLWLKGEKSPTVGQIIAAQTKEYFAKLPGARDGLAARRPVGPALHAAISEALANFALRFVPAIVEDHSGTLIYAGGDDVLALVPTRQALACARQLSDTFQKDWELDDDDVRRLLMGSEATVSAGLAIVHYKEDLRFALGTARRAEKTAKQAGRNALQITACRRSGEHPSAWCGWGYVATLDRLVTAFVQGASDRWTYQLRREAEVLRALPRAAILAEIARLVDRSERETKALLAGQEHAPNQAGAQIAAACDEYISRRLECERDETNDHTEPQREGDAFGDFVTLCQTASFLARGRDE